MGSAQPGASLTRFQISAVPNAEAARADQVTLGPGESVKTFRRFRDFTGRYVTRCSNAVLGDHGAMFQWKVV